ncbi:MAG TPA: M14 family metallopeptidase, partial [Myxococcota bacterium]
MSFRSDYLDYDALTAQLRAWASAHPAFVQLRSIGKSGEGRDMWLLVVGREPERARPALWIDGNMHAMELAGSSVALAFADELIALHVNNNEPSDCLAYVLPRMTPDGAEHVLKEGRYVRSVAVDDRPDQGTARWRIQDVDGDGLALTMRVRDEAGDFVESKRTPGLMIARQLEDTGPFYKLFPEGIIEGYDGFRVPAWQVFDDNRTDLNRNFPWSWAPEEEQAGAGDYATSTPEARAVVELAVKSPHLMVWINLHTYGGVYIRPLGGQPDSKMDREDLEVYRQMAAWVEQHTGYATVSGHEEFLYQPDKPLRGDSADFAYHQLGCMSVAVELWDLMQQAGIARKKPFIDNYQQLAPDDVEKIAACDGGRALKPWVKAKHPQLGDVEVGGIDPRFSVWNPPRELLDDTCSKNVRVFLKMLALLPRVHIEAKRTGDRIEIVVYNRGYLATHGLHSAKKLQLAEPLFAELVDRARAVDEPKKILGHLDGWG